MSHRERECAQVEGSCRGRWLFTFPCPLPSLKPGGQLTWRWLKADAQLLWTQADTQWDKQGYGDQELA